ncbi:MAG: hypothetical protein Q4C63_06595 [Eubacteriales bacterium]|nr:hypothetical protein [Eubacteriales bacterium]
MRNKKYAGSMIIGLAALMVSACAVNTGMSANAETGTQTIINNTTPTNPGPGASLTEDGETIAESAEGTEDDSRFTDTQPVRKWGTVQSVDTESGDIVILSNETYTDEDGNVQDVQQEIVFHTAQGVPVIDAVSGLPVQLSDIKVGETVYAWAAQAMTMSLPPQTSLQAMVVNIPADYAAPQYVAIQKVEKNEDGSSLVITDQDGNRWQVSEENTELSPYLTRQMISLMDIEEGRFCMIWPNAAAPAIDPPLYIADKLVLFNF